MSYDDKSHSVSHPLGTLSFEGSLYQGHESPQNSVKDVSPVEEHSSGEGAFAERGSSGEGGDSVGEEPQVEQEALVSQKKGWAGTS